jgi:hypothetical protein
MSEHKYTDEEQECIDTLNQEREEREAHKRARFQDAQFVVVEDDDTPYADQEKGAKQGDDAYAAREGRDRLGLQWADDEEELH